MSLDDFRKNQGMSNLGNYCGQTGTKLFLIIVVKAIQYTVLTLIARLCWNYLAPLFNLPKLNFLGILVLIILLEVLFLRGNK